MRLRRLLPRWARGKDQAARPSPRGHTNFDKLAFDIPAEVHDVPPAALRDDVTIAAVVRNEAPYMREWVAFHLAVGADRLLIYDNGSTDGLAAVLADFVALGVVEIIPWPHFIDRTDFQKTGMAHAIVYTRRTTRWLALIDADEFLFSPTGRPLPDILRGYESCPAVIVYWVNFGTSGHFDPPAGLVTESYRMRAVDSFPGNLLHKSIVNPALVRSVWGSHRFGFDQYPVAGCDENRQPVTEGDAARVHSSRLLRINHYYSRSRSEFETKLKHGRARHKPYLVEEKQRFLQALESDQVEDWTIQQFLPELRAWLEHPGLAFERRKGSAPPSLR